MGELVEVERTHIRRALRKNGEAMTRLELATAINLDPGCEVFREALEGLVESCDVLRELRSTDAVRETYVAVYKLSTDN